MKKNKKNKFIDFKNNTIVHFVFLFFLIIWIFAITMMPVNYQSGGQLTVIYTINTNLTLTPLGYITTIISILFVIHWIFMMTLFLVNKESLYIYKNLDKNNRNWYFLSSWITLLVVLVMMFCFIFVIPNTTEFREQWMFQEFVTSLNPSNITQQQHDTFINYVNKYQLVDKLKENGLANYDNFIGTNVGFNSSIISFLRYVHIDFSPKFFTPLYYVSQSAAVFSPLYYFNIVIFSISLFYYLVSNLILYRANNRSLENRTSLKERKEILKTLTAEFKQKLKNKKENKEKRKQLLKEEESLLVGLDAFESNEEVERISQEELQEKINKNNELKNRILEIHAQREKLKEESKLFKSKNKKEEINKRSTKIKKHEITIPDEELDEIFKNLDI